MVAAGGVGLALAGASPAAAGTDGDVVLGQTNEAGDRETVIFSSRPSPGAVLYLENLGTGRVLIARTEGSGDAVEAFSASGVGLRASSVSANGVDGFAGGANTTANGVYGHTSGTGNGVLGVADSGRGVVGTAGAAGRGGEFAGGKSQVRLVPSAATTHPTRGLAGDLFLDKSKRLWLCKGTTTWVQVA